MTKTEVTQDADRKDALTARVTDNDKLVFEMHYATVSGHYNTMDYTADPELAKKYTTQCLQAIEYQKARH